MLDQIFAPIQYQIARFEARLEEVMMASDVAGIQEMAYRVVKNRGRRFRPALALLTAQAVGECSDAVIDAAVGVELVQTASLVHDDVIDNAETRRGSDVLHLQWGNRTAILMGDFLFAKSMQVLVGLNSLPVMNATTHAIQRIVEGEILEGETAPSDEASHYFRMINKKTASLLALSCELGALLGKGSPDQVVRMASFGSEIGVAYQITDDVLDLIGDATDLGKPTGNDIREKKLTLPLICALANCKNGEAAHIRTKVLNGVKTDGDWREVTRFVQRYRGVEKARQEARSHARSALKNLNVLHTSRARDALVLAVQHVVERDR